jgi:hypothetical protein
MFILFSRMLVVLHGFIQVFLKFAHLVGDEAKRVVERKPLDVLRVFLQVVPQAIKLRKHFFNFDRHWISPLEQMKDVRIDLPRHTEPPIESQQGSASGPG